MNSVLVLLGVRLPSAEEQMPKCGTKLVSANFTSVYSLESKNILGELEFRTRVEGAAEN